MFKKTLLIKHSKSKHQVGKEILIDEWEKKLTELQERNRIKKTNISEMENTLQAPTAEKKQGKFTTVH